MYHFKFNHLLVFSPMFLLKHHQAKGASTDHCGNISGMTFALCLSICACNLPTWSLSEPVPFLCRFQAVGGESWPDFGPILQAAAWCGW